MGYLAKFKYVLFLVFASNLYGQDDSRFSIEVGTELPFFVTSGLVEIFNVNSGYVLSPTGNIFVRPRYYFDDFALRAAIGLNYSGGIFSEFGTESRSLVKIGDRLAFDPFLSFGFAYARNYVEDVPDTYATFKRADEAILHTHQIGLKSTNQLRTGSKGSFFSLSSIVIELGARWEDRLILIEEKTMEEDRYHEWKTHPRSRLRTNGLDDDSKDFRRIGWYGTVGIEF